MTTRGDAVVATGDLGPLAWILEETRKSIEASAKALKRFARETELAHGGELSDADAGQLRVARQQLHQVVGALEMIGQGMAARMARGMESAVQQFVLNPGQCNEAAAGTLERAGFALIEYLESQLGEHPRPALGLFPQFRQVQEMAGADRIHPADLWPVEWHWAEPVAPAAAQDMAYGREVRQQLDQRMLKIMRDGDANAASELGVISLGLASGESARQPAVFWRLAAAFFEALGQSLIPLDAYTRRAASRILLQYTSLARGEQVVSERLALDLLFFCAQARPGPGKHAPVLDAVRRAWALDTHEAVAYGEPMFGLFDPAVLAQARRRVEAVKENWSALAGGDMARLKGCVDQFGLAAESLVKLHQRGKPLADALNQVAEHTAQSNQPPTPELAMETATAILFLEASFADFQPGDPQFTDRTLSLAERLNAVRQGGKPQALESWMEELYRRFSERQTMGTVIGELRVTMGEVEQHLDRFFRNPADLTPLDPVPGLMSQMRGVLSVLGLEQAASAVGHMRYTIEGLLAGQTEIEQIRSEGAFDKLGNSLGALGFLIDMLAYQPVLAKKLFAYDEQTGQLKPLVERSQAEMPEPVDAPVETSEALAAPGVPPVSDDSLDFDLDLHLDLEETPDTPSVPERPPEPAGHAAVLLPAEEASPQSLLGPLEHLAITAALDEKPALAHAANRAVEAARGQDEEALSGALDHLNTLSRPAEPVAELALAGPDDEGGEEDLLDIFLEEARGVMHSGSAALVALEADPADMEQQTTLRRAFHTLKGSSRMVGLAEFGDAAWSMEQLLNTWLSEHQPVTQDLREFSGEALLAFSRWIEDVAARKDGHWQAAPFSLAADALRTQGQRLPLLLDEREPGVAETAGMAVMDEVFAGAGTAEVELEAIELPEPASLGEAEPSEEDPQQDVMLEWSFVDDEAEAPLGDSTPAVAAEPVETESAEDRSSSIAPTQPMALEPASKWLDLDLLIETEDEETPAEAEAANETPGSESEPGLQSVPESEPEPAAKSESLLEPEPEPEAELSHTGEYKHIGDLRISIPLYNVYLNEADEWSRMLITELSEWSLELQRPVPEAAISCAHSLAGSSATVGFADLSGLARAVEHALQRLRGQSAGTARQAHVLSDAAEDIRRLLHQFAAGILKAPDATILEAVHDLESADLGAEAPVLDAEPAEAPAPETAVTISDAPAHAIADGIDVVDAVDMDLLPIFLEEAEELIPRLSTMLRHWMAHPADPEARGQVLRGLHTLKGSARLTGAMRLGEIAHRSESAIELLGTEALSAGDLEPLLEYLDELQTGFQRLLSSDADLALAGAAEAPADFHEEIAPAPVVQEDVKPYQVPASRTAIALPAELSLASSRVAASQMVRVRSQLLDRLVNRAGEMITSRTRLEAEVRQVRNLLGDLTGNLDRLRAQLRDVELQAETQMQSRLALSKDAQQNFDPLEFDRFTRMQELTRMMAESVNDVATVQRSLQLAIDASEDDLAAQGRQSRELQRDLLRTHMVEFEAISERLYRAVRQASKEMGKRVRLEITGGSIEMDRGILDRMAPAFEHLLRNCVVHGIETADTRAARGKVPEGVISIEVHQAGNDVSVEFRDDGGGLDIARIRERAIQTGLITADQALSEPEFANLIFAPGFSTAAEVTELAGRGIGMDVVRSEIQALGGRVETSFREGEGTSFKLVMPLTTAVTHVVMLRAGNMVIGVPSSLVEVVQRTSLADLGQAYETASYRHGAQTMPFFWSGALLQSSPRSTETPGKSASVIVLRSAEQRLALHVDEVVGNQEVVVKKLGPQLSRLPGLVAITALATGSVALIYNPVALAAVYGEQAKAFVAADVPEAADPAGQGSQAAAQAAEPEIPLVLVVDDSITVRRVTQRLLQREGYRVALAADGMQGLERLQTERPAVVLSDIEMPRMDGFDFVRNIRGDRNLRGLPVIMITSRIAEKHREHARELGVNHYLGKPYSEEELLRLVAQYAHSPIAAV
ncbi:MAG: Hpt domain-containing protein [Ottowia sp.]|uniref:hybrid sensor histidine kinase/response regulator n=1 Tax=Ottowia sp. TaxID=1898956 RepID=UPI003C7392A9